LLLLLLIRPNLGVRGGVSVIELGFIIMNAEARAKVLSCCRADG
jgi:hypothetical protein